MCDYANYLERKARNEGISQGINQGKKIERIVYFHTLYLTFHIKF